MKIIIIIKNWNGDIENINKINPSILKLKNELALNIQQELLESEGDNISQNKNYFYNKYSQNLQKFKEKI